jgi:hypothetical protein
MAAHLMPDQPWRKIGSFANVIRHEYDATRDDYPFGIVKNDFPRLCAAAEEALRQWDLLKLPDARGSKTPGFSIPP